MGKPYNYKASASGVSPAAAAPLAPVEPPSVTATGASGENTSPETVTEAVTEAVPTSPVEECADPEPSKADRDARAAGHPTASDMLEMIADMCRGVSKLHAAAEYHARALVRDATGHAKFTRLANGLADFRHSLTNV